MLWRSGRPDQESIELDPQRVRDLIAGYHRIAPQPTPAADAITVCIRARGIQQAVKAFTTGQPLDKLRTRRIRWVSQHHPTIRDWIAQSFHAQLVLRDVYLDRKSVV